MQRERPIRQLNIIINGFPEELIAAVYPYATKYVRPIVKVPMITIMTCCGVSVGLNLVAFTFLGELLQSGTFLDEPGLIILLVTVGLICSLSLLFVTNYVSSMYDQLDAMPVFFSLSIVSNIICGLILLGEADRYGTGNLIGISFAVLITVSGIFVLGAKKNYLANAERKRLEEAN